MKEPKPANTGGAAAIQSAPDEEFESLTREQQSVLNRLINKFREGAMVQVLTGAHETGKTKVAELVGRRLESQAVTVHINKQTDQPPGTKRLMQEAYGSYPFLLAAILKQVGFYARGEETDLVEQMVERLRALRQEEKRLLIVLDDAQDITPGVWKRLQSWLDYQDRGMKMIQVLLVGSPMVRKMMGEPILRGWRRWVHGTYELHLLKGGRGVEEARRALRNACDSINARARSEEPLNPPHLSWFAIRKILHEAGGRPGRMNELVRRALAASIREGGVSITRRFLSHADALRSHAVRVQAVRKAPEKGAEKGAVKTPDQAPRPRPPKGSATGLDWMRYALGALLVVFILGAGWGITAWLSLPKSGEAPNEVVEATPEESLPETADLDSPSTSLEDPFAPAPEQVPVGSGDSLAAAPEVTGVSSSSQPSLQSFIEGAALPSIPEEEPGGIWNPIDEVAKSKVLSTSLEHDLLDVTSESTSAPTGTDLAPALPSGVTAPNEPSAPDSTETVAKATEPEAPVLPEMKAEPVAAVPPAPAMEKSSPRKAEPAVIPSKAKSEPSSETKPTQRPRLKKKTLEALARLEKKL
ncbi:MAG: AAA family ATPase [Candidatus Omnitrophica bacterium]|nr:hypothetical protein [bacterium]NUN95138.1 AAA family ATPase [Candidatus Omnitrophota bacterium]